MTFYNYSPVFPIDYHGSMKYETIMKDYNIQSR